MKTLRRQIVTAALTALAVLGTAPAARALCGDLNNDGSVTVADAIIMAQCTALAPAPCPAVTCTGGLAACGDMFGDGDTTSSGGRTADLDALVNSIAGIETLHDLCASIGAARTDCTLGSQDTPPVPTISASERWTLANCPLVTVNGTLLIETPAVGPTTVLTIEPGVIIQGVKGASDPSAVIFITTDSNSDGIPDRAAKINAQGTAANPIVFTSNQPDETRAKGDWAGLMFNGLSTVNRPGCVASAEGLPTAFGGCDPDHSSGIARYVRVEYCGQDFTPNNELNTFTMNAVGSGTQFDHIQGHVGDDDCIEWFGGTVNHTHMVASACGDDGFDWQLGWTGSLQFGVVLQHGNLTDPTTRDSRGLEGDNSEFGNNDLPRSNPDFCNLSAISPLNATGDNGGSDVGILFRRGTAGMVANSIVEGFQDAGIELRDASTTQMACTNPTTLNAGDPNLRVRSTAFYGNGNSTVSGTEHCKRSTCFDGSGNTDSTVCEENADCPITHPFCHVANNNCSPCDFYNLLVAGESVVPNHGTNLTSAPITPAYPADGDLVDLRVNTMVAGLPAPTSCAAINERFVDTGYLGALNPAAPCSTTGPGASCDWLTQPWISFDPD